MTIEASIPTATATLRRVLLWVTAAAGVADIVLVAIAVKRHRQPVPEISLPALNELDPRFGRAADAEWQERARTIRAEIAAMGSNPDWAGDYYQGDGLGENVHVRLAPESGFVFEWTSCTRFNDRNFGTVRAMDGHIALSFQFPNERDPDRGLAPELVPIRWGERKYLVALDKMEDFCADANSGDEPRSIIHGRYLMRVGDENRSVSGVPVVPAKYEKLLINPPIEVRVVEVLESWKHDTTVFLTRVRIDAGSDQGVVPGLRMQLIEPSEVRSLTVVDVSKQSSIAIVKRSEASASLPAIGWKFSTMVWNR
jgi:hypothetical protein